MQIRNVIIAAALATSSGVSADCNCEHNNDAGRWKDDQSPADVVQFLVAQNGGCHQATAQGNLCVSMQNANAELKDCLEDFARAQQSQHGDWFLWTSIQCSAGAGRGQISMTA